MASNQKGSISYRLHQNKKTLGKFGDQYKGDESIRNALLAVADPDLNMENLMPPVTLTDMIVLTKLSRVPLLGDVSEALDFMLSYINQRIAYQIAHERRHVKSRMHTEEGAVWLRHLKKLEKYIEEYWPDYAVLITTKVSSDGVMEQVQPSKQFDRLFLDFERLL